MKWFIKCFKQYADFKGRARRKEYWMFTLINGILGFVIGLLGLSILSWIYSIAVFIPSLAVCVRRIHDIGKSAWWILLFLIPVIGWIWLIILFVQDSQPGENQWGENPKGEYM
jgi:uncharacterized membrane protein YhaH (DUF805 family)